MPLKITVNQVKQYGIDIHWDKDNSEGLIGGCNNYIFKYLSYSFFNDKNELLNDSSQINNDSYKLQNVWIRSIEYNNSGYQNSSSKIVEYFTSYYGDNYQKGLIKYNALDTGKYAYIWLKDDISIALVFITIDAKTKVFAFSKMTKEYYLNRIIFEAKSFDIN